MNLEINLPDIPEGGMITAKQARQISEQLYSLQEYLRYMFSHIDADNLTDDLKKKIAEGGDSAELVQRVEDTEGNYAQLKIAAEGLLTRVQNAEGAVSEVQQTAAGLSSRVSDAEGNISEVRQTAAGLSSRVSDAEGDISDVRQTADGLSSRVSNAEGMASSAQQTADGLSSRVTNAEGKATSAQQTADSLSWEVSNLAGEVASLSITSSGIMAAVNNNRLVFSAAGLEIRNAYGQTVFRQDNSSGNLTISGNITATGGNIGGLTVYDYGLFYGSQFGIDLRGSWPVVRIGNMQFHADPQRGIIFGDEEAPTFAANTYSGVYVKRLLGYEPASLEKWIMPEPYAKLDAAVAARDAGRIDTEAAALVSGGRTSATVKGQITGEAKKAYLAAYYAGDKGGMDAVVKTLTGLKQVKYDRKVFKDWIKDDLTRQLLAAVKGGDTTAAAKYRDMALREGVSKKDMLDALEKGFKDTYRAHIAAGNQGKADALMAALVALDLSASRVRGCGK